MIRSGADSNDGDNGFGPDGRSRGQHNDRFVELLIAEQSGTISDSEAFELAGHPHFAHPAELGAQRELALDAALTAAAAVGGSASGLSTDLAVGGAVGLAAVPSSLAARLVSDAERCLGKPLPPAASLTASVGRETADAGTPRLSHPAAQRDARALPADVSRAPVRNSTAPWAKVAAPWLLAAAATVAAVFAWVRVPSGPLPEPGSDLSAGTRIVSQLAKAADRKLWAFAPNVPEYKAVTGVVQWSPGLQAGTMTLSGLRPLAAGEGVYQLWIVDGSREKYPVDGGIFSVAPGSDGQAVVPFTPRLPVGAPTAFAITREKAEGVVVSAGPLLLVASTK